MIPLQFLSYQLAVMKGIDVDFPNNLGQFRVQNKGLSKTQIFNIKICTFFTNFLFSKKNDHSPLINAFAPECIAYSNNSG